MQRFLRCQNVNLHGHAPVSSLSLRRNFRIFWLTQRLKAMSQRSIATRMRRMILGRTCSIYRKACNLVTRMAKGPRRLSSPSKTHRTQTISEIASNSITKMAWISSFRGHLRTTTTTSHISIRVARSCSAHDRIRRLTPRASKSKADPRPN